MNTKKIVMSILVCTAVLFFKGAKAEAAFPADMEQKPVKAYSIKGGELTVYKDAKLQKKAGSVNGGSLTIEAYKVSEKGIFGNYQSGNQKGSGWLPLSAFVSQTDYKHVYATVRDAMYIYEDSTFSSVLTTIKKYTGVIVISKEGDKRQVICDKKDHYEIGWMTSSAFSNTLLYDGREKRTLKDGTYEFNCGYQDDRSGGKSQQTTMDQYEKHTWKIQYITRNCYYIQNTQDGKYLSVVYQKKQKEYVLVWTEKPDEKRGQFQFHRIYGSYAIRNTKTSLFLAQNENQELVLLTNRNTAESHWRVRAQKKMSDQNNPFVFTQYDPQWCSTPYGGGGCMGTAGCGVLAAVNAVYALNGQSMDVMELADYAVEKNYRIVGSGTDDGIFKAACKKFGRKYGFAWDGQSGSIDVLKKKLKAGDTAIVHVPGHYVCISDYNQKTKKFLLLDSNYLPKRMTSAFGDWIRIDRLLSGTLESQNFYFFKRSGS